MTKEILTAGVTDWVTGLEQVYARQSKQLEEHHANVNAQYKAKLEKTKTESLKANAKLGAQAVTQVTKLKKLLSDVKGTKKIDKEKEDEVKVWFARLTQDKKDDYFNGYQREKDDINEDSKTFKEFLATLKSQNKGELYDSVRKFNPIQQVLAKELIAGTRLNSVASEGAYLTHLSQNNIDGDIAEYNNSKDKNAILLKWQEKELAALGLSDSFWARHIAPELSRQKNIRANIQRNNTNAAISTAEDNEWLVQAQAYPNDKIGRNDYFKYAHEQLVEDNKKLFEKNGWTDGKNPEGLTPTQVATSELTNRFTRLLSDEKLTIADIEEYLGHPVEHAAGDTNEKAFFSKGQVNDLVASARMGLGKNEARRQAGLEARYQEVISKRNAGKYETQEDYLAALSSLEKNGYKNSEALNAAEKFDIKVLDKNSVAGVYKIWEGHKSNGFYGVTQAHIDAIPYEELQGEMSIIFNKIQEARKGYTKGENGNLNGSVQGIIENSVTRIIPWAKGMPENNQAKAISLEIDRDAASYELSLILDQYKDGVFTKDPDIGTKVNIFKENLFKSRGGGTKQGLYGVNNDGQFQNYKDYIAGKTEIKEHHNTKLNSENAELWLKGIVGDLNKDIEHKQKLAPYSIDDIQGMMLTTDLSDKMEFIADRLGVPVGVLIQNSINKIKADESVDKQSQLIGLEDFETENQKHLNAVEEIDANLDAAYKRYEKIGEPNTYEALTIKDAQILLRKGWHRLSLNQKGRILATLVTNEELSQKESNDAAKIARRTIAKEIDQSRNVDGALENFNQSIVPYDASLVEQTGTEETGTANITPNVGVVTTGPDGKTYHLSPSGWAEVSGAEGNYETVKFYDLLPDQRPNAGNINPVNSNNYPDGIKRKDIFYNKETNKWELNPLK